MRPDDPRRATLRATAYKLASALVLACMFALIKSLGSRYPIGEIVFARSAFALLPIIVALHASSQWSTLRTSRPLAHLRRSVAGVASLFLSFGAVSLLPLSTATALTYSAPLFITLLSIVLLGEQVTLGRWAAVLIGFVGMLMVIQPDLEAGLPLGKVLGVLAAVATAVALVAIRQMAASESALAIAFYFTLFGTLVGAATLPLQAVVPDGADALRLVSVGVLGGMAQLLLTMAYRLAPASVLAPYEYATLVGAILVGFIVWGEMPGPVEWLGIVVIVGANVGMTAHEQARARRARRGPASDGTDE
ncbi:MULTISPECIES: DMT family transporter [Pseudomonadota]|uniref:DMT family transporter n=1 Tax=Pseudomonadota TaxID=1224 RepID=UPI000E3116CE|nr:DMT family transporter [Paracidovorax citrulli]RLJ95010.1 threonine/homoserine efflux transporter RhtA [Paracidovorax citrulli]WIY44636.1 DMT family transporter [Paracidovorax citrulli]